MPPISEDEMDRTRFRARRELFERLSEEIGVLFRRHFAGRGRELTMPDFAPTESARHAKIVRWVRYDHCRSSGAHEPAKRRCGGSDAATKPMSAKLPGIP